MGPLGLVRQEPVGVAMMEEEQASMEVWRLEEEVEQPVKKVPPSLMEKRSSSSNDLCNFFFG